ncbi:hypothetical protein E5288_WYG010897 [Bos mutus]|uniref:Claudin n=1 Tax=Bos mutus TaxID=72004 RepID=A0A6B0R1D8_9CETA|nr:hypothetical protein [Bos mutus]
MHSLIPQPAHTCLCQPSNRPLMSTTLQFMVTNRIQIDYDSSIRTYVIERKFHYKAAPALSLAQIANKLEKKCAYSKGHSYCKKHGWWRMVMHRESGIIAATCMDQWSTQDLYNNPVTAVFNYQGLWRSCVRESSGFTECRGYFTLLGLPGLCKIGRAVLFGDAPAELTTRTQVSES